MANSLRGDSNPFDAQSSGRDPFPSFEAALAHEQPAEQTEDEGAGFALDWSIDTLAELKPVPFSPLPQQKDGGNRSATPHGASGFFEDETQYGVLRTPASAVRPSRETPSSANGSRAVLTFTPSPVELHRRCRETIARCEARVRERQRKMDKLQAVLPPPTPQRSARRRGTHQRSTPMSRTTPPRPAKRNRLSFTVTPSSERKTPGAKPPKWSASPIAMAGRQPCCATPATLHFDATTPSPLVGPPRQRSKTRLSFGLSPIAFSSPEQAAQEEKSEEQGEEHSAAEENALPLSSTEESAASSSPEKENGDQAQHGGGREQGATPTAAKKASAAPMRASIPRRQRAFMEAIEAEARSNEAPAPSRTAASSSSAVSLYQEAKTQWQHVQLLRESEQKHNPTPER